MIIRPQPGPQELFLASIADIVIYGGAAGGGKSWAILMEVLRHIHNQQFGAVVFRRTCPQITNEGGLWDTAAAMYPHLGAVPKAADLAWTFPSGARCRFAHMQYEKDMYAWQGSQIPLIMFDELTHFTRAQFFYMLSRNRSTCGVRPYIRASTNPDPDSWVREFIDWWIGEDGSAIPERSGVVRWFAVQNGEVLWYDTKEAAEAEGHTPKSFTFIASSVYDNKALLDADPGYLANLKALDRVEQARLLGGNWDIRHSAGDLFKRQWFEVVEPDSVPKLVKCVRYWDRAATEPSTQNRDPDWTAGVLMGVDSSGTYYVLDVRRDRQRPAGVERTIKATATQDDAQQPKRVTVGLEEDPGQAGKADVANLIRLLAGHDARACKISGDKMTRARPFSAQCEASNVRIVRGEWNRAYLDELEAFPTKDVHDDQVDASSGAFNHLAAKKEFKAFVLGA